MNRRNYLLIILIIFILIISFLINFNFENKKYIIFNKNNIWQINDNKITKIDSKNINKLNFLESKLYSKGFIDSGYFYYNKDIIFYENSYYKRKMFDDSFITVNINKDLKVKLKNNILLNEDNNIVLDYLKERNINVDLEEIFVEKINISSKKTFYSVKSLENCSEQFSFVFINDNNSYKTIYYNDNITNRSSVLHLLMDINNDNNYDIVLYSDIPNSDSKECYSLYLYNNGDYNKTIDCEKGE